MGHRHLELAVSEIAPSPTPNEGQQDIREFDPAPVRDNVRTVRAGLGSLEGDDLADEQRERLERYRAIADFVEAYVDFLVIVKDATAAFDEADEQ